MALNNKPFFSIITVTKNSAWSLLRTARSVFEQNFQDIEYIIVDGLSNDHTQSLIQFWQNQGLVTLSVSESDYGVYNAMNKGLRLARGEFVLFLNTNDTFASSNVLQKVHDLLRSRMLDGVLGWGELNQQIWASWVVSEGFKLASLGFCHQALYVRRELLLNNPFDERPFKTDSDTLQLGNLIIKGAKIAIFPEVLAIRGGDPGLSADLERSGHSIRTTLLEEYPALSDHETEQIIWFRRQCKNPEAIIALLDRTKHADTRLALHLAYMVLDTLHLQQSRKLDVSMCNRLLDVCIRILIKEPDGLHQFERLIFTQTRKAVLMRSHSEKQIDMDQSVAEFEQAEWQRIHAMREAGRIETQPSKDGLIISLTSYPARIQTVSFAIQSLFEQTHPPREIHLWLGRDEIPNRNWLPKRLCMLEERGLQIHFADHTFHHYDKFLHIADLNRDAPLVIVDDDVIYPPSALRHLLDGHQSHPNAIIANRCHQIRLTANGEIAPYADWEREVRQPQPSFSLFPTGAGGVLYPSGYFTDHLVTDTQTLLAVAPYADDIWLKVCALAKKIPTYATNLSHKSDWYHQYTPTMNMGSLMAVNVDRGLNDTQIALGFAWLSQQNPEWFKDFFAEKNCHAI